MINGLWAISVLAAILIAFATPVLARLGKLNWAWVSVAIMTSWALVWRLIDSPAWSAPDSASRWGIVVSVMVAAFGAGVILVTLLAIRLRRKWSER